MLVRTFKLSSWVSLPAGGPLTTAHNRCSAVDIGIATIWTEDGTITSAVTGSWAAGAIPRRGVSKLKAGYLSLQHDPLNYKNA